MLADVIENALDFFTNAKTKLLCQTFDGAAIIAVGRNGVQIKFSVKGFEYGDFIQCCAHKFGFK